jgi:hypothetical protein
MVTSCQVDFTGDYGLEWFKFTPLSGINFSYGYH